MGNRERTKQTMLQAFAPETNELNVFAVADVSQAATPAALYPAEGVISLPTPVLEILLSPSLVWLDRPLPLGRSLFHMVE